MVEVKHTVPHMDKPDAALSLLDEARGFAAMSPQGRDNVADVAEMIPEITELAYRAGFEDGEKHRAEYLDIVFDRMLEEAIRRMNQPKILGFDGEGYPIDNPEYLPHSDSQIGVEFAIEYLRERMADDIGVDEKSERKENSYFVPVPNSGTNVHPDLEHLCNLRAALEPFRSGGDWGKIKAWVVAGAPNTDDAIAAMKWLTSCQVAVDKVLSPPAREEGGRDDD